ncbi:MAG: GNAT family N-acetyltransferase [Steroidobacteraceae bacterium]
MTSLKLPITTGRLSLREFGRGDLEALMAYSADPRVTRYMFFGPRDEDASRDHLQEILDSQAERPRTRYELAVEHRETGRVIGACDLSMIERNVLDLGYMLEHASWGSGFATEVSLALIDAAFLDLAAERVISTVDINNRASIRVLEKVGLQWEATFRKARRAKNRRWDCHVFALARTMWESQRSTAAD